MDKVYHLKFKIELMPSWKEHMEFCMEHGIDKEICDFANRLVDFPEEIIPNLLKDRKLKEYLAERLDLTLDELDRIVKETETIWKIKTGKICEECSFRVKCKFKDLEVKPKYLYLAEAKEWGERKHVVINVSKDGRIQKRTLDKLNSKQVIKVDFDKFSEVSKNFIEYRKRCPILRDYEHSNAIHHEKLHNYSARNRDLRLIKEIARYIYGEDGVKAVELHLELDEFRHIMSKLKNLIPAYLSRGLSGKTSDRETHRRMNCSVFIRKYIYKKPKNILWSLKPSNLCRFKRNLNELLNTTVGEFLKEYGIEYDGILSDKKISEIIEKYRSHFGKLPELTTSN